VTSQPNHTVPVRIRGVLFPSQRAAAKFFNVSPTAIHQRLENGTLDGLVPGGKGGRPPRPCVINGVRYETTQAAAKALGIPEGTIRRNLSRGNKGWFRPQD
jgi:hypothetical protein